MFLNKIRLKNIRSYIDSEIEFPKGTTLLSGDIGSGKSTILLAIEFALFGLKRGSGEGLLRNGSDSGCVELDFNIEDKNIIVKRNLKRSRDSVSQDTGFLNDEEFSATELKQRVLDLLNYPKEMLTKDSLIYRYTVYTPQEEMKSILLGEKESRLDTLRKVFGIDKYKRVKENSLIFNAFLREKIKELDGRIYDLAEKQNELEARKKELESRRAEFFRIKPDYDKAVLVAENFKRDISKIENEVAEFNLFNNKLEVCKSKILQNEKMLNENNLKLEGIKVSDVDAEKIKILESEVLELRNLANALQFKLKNCEEIKNNISGLNKCPTCEQTVSAEYKRVIISREENNIKEFGAKFERTMVGLNEKEKELSELQKIFRENEMNLRLKKDLIRRNESLSLEISDFREELGVLKTKVSGLKNVQTNYEAKKNEFEKIISELRKIEIEKTKIESDVANISGLIKKFSMEIEEKLECKAEKEKWGKIQFFLKEQFVSLVQMIEKNIMLKVHGDFNSLFIKWFNMIISPELLNVRLDDEFTPLIEQNGHEIGYEFLSGGEKTAIALAYRLALNQVINSLMSEIKTRDLLILDEPTDGFSSEQLDKVRDVLDELRAGQIIMVSHDAKVESFVENILRLEKQKHVSYVI